MKTSTLTLFLHSLGIPTGSLATAFRASYHCKEKQPETINMQIKSIFVGLLLFEGIMSIVNI